MNTVTIPETEYMVLQEAAHYLFALEDHGVVTWGGHNEAANQASINIASGIPLKELYSRKMGMDPTQEIGDCTYQYIVASEATPAMVSIPELQYKRFQSDRALMEEMFKQGLDEWYGYSAAIVALTDRGVEL